MKTTLTRSVLGIATALTVASLALAGCAPTGGDTGGNTGNTDGGPGANNLAPAKTYTEPDLVKILNQANTTLQANGTVKDIGLLADAQSSKTESLPDRIKDQGGTLTPTECGPLFNKVTNDLLTLGNNGGAYAATLTYGTTVVSATSSAKPGNAGDLEKLIIGDINAMNSTCSTMNFTFSNGGHTSQYKLTFQKQDVKTDAGVAHAYNEVTTVGASTVHTVSGVLVDSNLLIGFAGISSATTIDDLTKAMNAVYDAAK